MPTAESIYIPMYVYRINIAISPYATGLTNKPMYVNRIDLATLSYAAGLTQKQKEVCI